MGNESHNTAIQRDTGILLLQNHSTLSNAPWDRFSDSHMLQISKRKYKKNIRVISSDDSSPEMTKRKSQERKCSQAISVSTK